MTTYKISLQFPHSTITRAIIAHNPGIAIPVILRLVTESMNDYRNNLPPKTEFRGTVMIRITIGDTDNVILEWVEVL